MPNKLCIFGCHNFRQEVSAAIAAEGWPDVVAAAFPARCGRPPVSWEELLVLLPDGCTQVVVLGSACLAGLGEPPAGSPAARLLPQQQCFNMVADSRLVADAIDGGGYLMTPGWLTDWRGRLADMGFPPAQADQFFKDFARELVLFDTGVDPEAGVRLNELANIVGLPPKRIAVGLDHLSLQLARTVLEWRVDDERRDGQELSRRHARELADHVAAMDLLARLAKTQHEAEAIAAIEELFRMLFSPATWHYLRAEHGQPVLDPDLPDDLLAAVQGLASAHAWTPSGQGFLLRIARGDRLLGLIVVDHLAYPEYRERYLNLALAMSGVCALAIDEARAKAELQQYQHGLEELVAERTTAYYLAKEAAEAANRAKSAFLAAASHDLRQPIMAINLFRDALARTELSEEQKRLSDYLSLSTQNLGGILNTLLHISRLDSGTIKPCLEVIPAEALFRNIDAEFSPLALAKSLRFKLYFPLREMAIRTDVQLLHSLLGNLIVNAIKHTERGGVLVGIRDRGNHILLQVYDTGSGIAAEYLDKIFDEYFQIGNPERDSQKGLGLGLSIARRIATLLETEVVCRSQLGKGSVFEFRLPLADRPQDADGKHVARPSA